MHSVSSDQVTYARAQGRNWIQLIRKGALILGLAAVAIVALLLLLLWHLFGEMHFSTRSANAVVTQIMSHALVPDAVGIVALPPPLASNSQDGHVYVTVDPNGTTWILFPTWRGKGDDLAACVYHSASSKGPPPAQITLNGPDLGAAKAAPLAYVVDRKIDANWYHVVWNMD